MKSSRLFTALSLAAIVLTAVFARAPRAIEALTNCTVSGSDLDYDAEEKNFLVLLNDYRASVGAPALTPSANLNRSAAWMARDLVQRGDLPSHVDTLGRDPLVRMQQCDAVAPGGNIAENIAGGPTATGAEILAQWKQSPSHDGTMRRPDLKQIGIARAYNPGNQFPWQWTTNFSTVDDGTNIGVPISQPQQNLESPQPGNVTSSFYIAGWAIDRGATSNTGIDQVYALVYPCDSTTAVTGDPVFQGPTAYGAGRDDIANAFGAQFRNSYYVLQTPAFKPGLYLVVVYIHSTIGNTWTPVSRMLNVPGS
jgi:uncharacterized protein YkwD